MRNQGLRHEGEAAGSRGEIAWLSLTAGVVGLTIDVTESRRLGGMESKEKVIKMIAVANRSVAIAEVWSEKGVERRACQALDGIGDREDGITLSLAIRQYLVK